MITQPIDTEKVSGDLVYALEARNNTPFLVLSSVEFQCRICGKGAYIDLTLVPAHQVAVTCGACGTPLFNLLEEDFEYELQIAREYQTLY
jgi:hypothetical protein